MITQNQLNNWFTYHRAIPEQDEAYKRIRAAALVFAKVIVQETPASADQTAAIRKVREAVFTANATIACYQRQESGGSFRIEQSHGPLFKPGESIEFKTPKPTHGPLGGTVDTLEFRVSDTPSPLKIVICSSCESRKVIRTSSERPGEFRCEDCGFVGDAKIEAS